MLKPHVVELLLGELDFAEFSFATLSPSKLKEMLYGADKALFNGEISFGEHAMLNEMVRDSKKTYPMIIACLN